jgi:Tfp pilus assembly protein PilO
MSATNRNLLVGGIIIVIALLAWFFVIQPKRNQEEATRNQIATLNAEYEALKRVADQKPLYLALTKQIRQRLTGVELTADPRAYIPSYLKQIEDLARRDGLEVTLVTPQATPTPSPAPSSSPGATGAQQVANVVSPIRTAARVAGSEGASTAEQAQGPVQPSPAASGAVPVAANATAAPGAAAKGAQPATARQKAIAYLNQSFTQVPINMEFDGTYNDLQRFLRDLNKFPKLLGVGDLTLIPSTNTGIGVVPHLRITLPITAYRLSPTAQAGTVPATGTVPAAGATPPPVSPRG